MPIYEYQCEKCGEQTEVIQKINDVRCALKARLDSRLPGGITKFKMEIAVTCG